MPVAHQAPAADDPSARMENLARCSRGQLIKQRGQVDSTASDRKHAALVCSWRHLSKGWGWYDPCRPCVRGPAPLPLRDFFLAHRCFWLEKSDRVLVVNCKPKKTIAASDTYGPTKSDERQAASAAARNRVIYFLPLPKSLPRFGAKNVAT